MAKAREGSPNLPEALVGASSMHSRDNLATLALAAGAVIASLADTLMPEGHEYGGPAVALSTAAGFVLSFVLSLM